MRGKSEPIPGFCCPGCWGAAQDFALPSLCRCNTVHGLRVVEGCGEFHPLSYVWGVAAAVGLFAVTVRGSVFGSLFLLCASGVSVESHSGQSGIHGFMALRAREGFLQRVLNLLHIGNVRHIPRFLWVFV